MVTPRRTSRRAVALLDALIAAVILGLALSAIVGLGGQALRSQVAGEQIATAAMLADEQLNLVLARGPDNYAQSFPVEGPCDPPFAAYRFKLEFAGGASDALAVRATIAWLSPSGEQTLTIETAIAPRPGDDPDPDRRPAETVERQP